MCNSIIALDFINHWKSNKKFKLIKSRIIISGMNSQAKLITNSKSIRLLIFIRKLDKLRQTMRQNETNHNISVELEKVYPKI